MCFQVYLNQVIGILKGNWSLRRRQRLPLRNSYFATTPSNSLFFEEEMSIKEKDFILGGESKSSNAKGPRLWYNLNSFTYDQRGGTYSEGSNDSVFWRFMPTRGRSEPKAKGPHHHKFQKLSVEYFSFGILLCSKGGESSVSK
jgi:hypothetical protein